LPFAGFVRVIASENPRKPTDVFIAYAVVIVLKPRLHRTELDALFIAFYGGNCFGKTLGCPRSVSKSLPIDGPACALRCKASKKYLEIVRALLRRDKKLSVLNQCSTHLFCVFSRPFAYIIVRSRRW